MLRSLSVVLLTILFFSFHDKEIYEVSPLAAYSAEWQKAEYMACNTGKNSNYFTTSEKEVLWILNMARINPPLFAETVLKKYPERSRRNHLVNVAEYKSLLSTLEKTKQLPLLYPDSLGWVSAKCHAISSGLAGYVGHQRQSSECNEKKRYSAECCDYGSSDPLDIIMDLVIDQGVPSLGHREALLGPYNRVGISIQPHKGYGTNTVLDFFF